MGTLFTIGRVAKLAQVNVETIRYYQRRGLVPEPEKIPGAYRQYPQATVDLIRFIKQIQAKGFSLDEISVLLRYDTSTSCSALRSMATSKVNQLKRQMDNLSSLQAELQSLLENCEGFSATCNRAYDNRACPHQAQCPLIGKLTLSVNKGLSDAGPENLI